MRGRYWKILSEDNDWYVFSSIRLVPNNQEVYMHAESDQSIIVEILERVDEVSDENAIK